ncbi:MAG TPA: hypothetical protein VKC15_21250 [Gemmatimonadales bacterium]|nr:hypothetical protein [Gemmatimonadales bacterium]
MAGDAAGPTLIYDGECGVCRQAVELLRLFPGKRWLAPVFSIPGVLPVARRIYAWIAMRRRCLVRGMEGR